MSADIIHNYEEVFERAVEGGNNPPPNWANDESAEKTAENKTEGAHFVYDEKTNMYWVQDPTAEAGHTVYDSAIHAFEMAEEAVAHAAHSAYDGVMHVVDRAADVTVEADQKVYEGFKSAFERVGDVVHHAAEAVADTAKGLVGSGGEPEPHTAVKVTEDDDLQ